MSKKDLNSIEAFDPSIRQDLKASLNAIDNIEKLTKNSNAVMTETEFRDKFLPYLVKRGNEERSLEVWWSRIGTPMRGIDVVDPLSNNTIFTVPPLLRSHSDKSLDTGNMLVSDIITTASKKAEIIPNMGVRHIKEFLTNRVKPIQATKDLLDWNNILLRYGYQPIVDNDALKSLSEEMTDSSKKTSESHSKISDEDFVDL